MKYMIKMFSNFNIKKLKSIVDECSEKSNKSKLYIFFDMIYCFLVYKAGYSDYILFKMYDMSTSDRKTLLTRGKNNYYIKKLNPKKYWEYIDNKAIFNDKFKDYLNRDFIVLDGNNYNDFKEFLTGKDDIIVKPLDATGGGGVEKIRIDKSKIKSLYSKLCKNKQYLVEEVAKQHKDINKLHPSSINTIRIVTIRNKYNVTTVVAAVCRMGTNGRVVDNFHSGGIYAPLDVKTGTITDKAIDRQGNIFDTHPTTNVKLIGYQMPKWDEVIKLVTDASKEIKELGLIGWDVCIGPDKPCLIEANQYPGYDLYRPGMLLVFKDAMKKRNK